MTRARGGLLGLYGLLVYAFLYAPLLVLVVFSFNQGRLSATWAGATLHWYGEALRDERILLSLRNSLVIAFVTTVLATAAGTAVALAFHRHRFRRQGMWDALEGQRDGEIGRAHV